MNIDPAIFSYYDEGREQDRVLQNSGPSLEHARIRELLARLLPPPPARILDVGGGPGTYAVPLAAAGYRVRLIDPIPRHVALAREAGIDAVPGEARALPEAGGTYHAALLFGPLYHLTKPGGRQAALAEAARVLVPGGLLLATAISRYSTMLLGLYKGLLTAAPHRQIIDQDLGTGQHRNPYPGDRRFFTTAYFHTPAGLEQEISDAGYTGITVYGVEGPGWLLDFDDPGWRRGMLDAARRTETEPALTGFSLNYLAAATAPGQQAS